MGYTQLGDPTMMWALRVGAGVALPLAGTFCTSTPTMVPVSFPGWLVIDDGVY